MATLILHNGYNKTGTTALQNFLLANRAALLKRGILYPEYGISRQHAVHQEIAAHHMFAGHFCPKAPGHFRDGLDTQTAVDKLMDEVRRSGADTVVLSSEMMTFFDDVDAASFKTLLEQFDEVKLVTYLRRQDRYAYSYYNSALRNGRCATGFDEFFATINFDYHDNLSKWAGLFGEDNIIVRAYTPGDFASGSIQADFLDAVGIEYGDDLVVAEDFPNPALPKSLVYLLQDINKFPHRNHWALVSYIQDFLNGLEGLPEAPDYFSREQRLAMLADYQASNEALAQRFNDGVPLFDEEPPADVGATGNFDDPARLLLARLFIDQWNKAGTESPSGRSDSLLRRLLGK